MSVDDDLLRTLHADHGHALFALALKLSDGDRQRAEDLVQETLLRAWRNPDAFEPDRGSVRAWLFTTVRNLAIDSWRRRGARVGEVMNGVLPERAAGLDEADRMVESWTIAEALDRLSPAHREVLVESYFRGCSVDETATKLGIPPGTVKSRTHYAMRALRLVLEEMGVTR